MNATEYTLEGTWEEVSLHAPEFAGRKVRVTVIAPASEPVRSLRASSSASKRLAIFGPRVPRTGSACGSGATSVAIRRTPVSEFAAMIAMSTASGRGACPNAEAHELHLAYGRHRGRSFGKSA